MNLEFMRGYMTATGMELAEEMGLQAMDKRYVDVINYALNKVGLSALNHKEWLEVYEWHIRAISFADKVDKSD